jgi:UDP-2,4-diacetamido-2,4,6-trideoxy-beta-L-altropyranose hydrolase
MSRVSLHCQTTRMAELIQRADLAIAAGGSSIWERAVLGLPAICIIAADNQAEVTETVAEFGAIVNAGWHSDVDDVALAALIEGFRDSARLRRMSERALAMVHQATGGIELADLMTGPLSPEQWQID